MRQFRVQRGGLRRNGVPAELRHRALPARLPHRRPPGRGRAAARSARPPATPGRPAARAGPVTPSSTTSGMPPTREPTTAVPHAIASRFTMPSGSYTDGQAKTSACVSSWMISGLGSISGIQITPDRVACSAGHQRGRPRRQAPACRPRRRSSTSCASGSSRGGRPQQHGHALLPGDPADEDHVGPGRVDAVLARARPVCGSGAYSAVSMPLRITRTRSAENLRVSGQDVGPHAVGDRHHRGRRGRATSAPPTTTARTRRRAARPSTAAAARASAS